MQLHSLIQKPTLTLQSSARIFTQERPCNRSSTAFGSHWSSSLQSSSLLSPSTALLTMACYLAVKHFDHMFEARDFAINTDHKPLTFTFKRKLKKSLVSPSLLHRFHCPIHSWHPLQRQQGQRHSWCALANRISFNYSMFENCFRYKLLSTLVEGGRIKIMTGTK